METYCSILGVEPDANEKTITKAYREKARRTHGDKGGNEANMQVLNCAHEQIKSDLLKEIQKGTFSSEKLGDYRNRFETNKKSLAEIKVAIKAFSTAVDEFHDAYGGLSEEMNKQIRNPKTPAVIKKACQEHQDELVAIKKDLDEHLKKDSSPEELMKSINKSKDLMEKSLTTLFEKSMKYQDASIVRKAFETIKVKAEQVFNAMDKMVRQLPAVVERKKGTLTTQYNATKRKLSEKLHSVHRPKPRK